MWLIYASWTRCDVTSFFYVYPHRIHRLDRLWVLNVSFPCDPSIFPYILSTFPIGCGFRHNVSLFLGDFIPRVLPSYLESTKLWCHKTGLVSLVPWGFSSSPAHTHLPMFIYSWFADSCEFDYVWSWTLQDCSLQGTQLNSHAAKVNSVVKNKIILDWLLLGWKIYQKYYILSVWVLCSCSRQDFLSGVSAFVW